MRSNKVYADLPNQVRLRELDTRWDFDDADLAYGIPETFSTDQYRHPLFGASKAASDLLVQEYGIKQFFRTGSTLICAVGKCDTPASKEPAISYGTCSVLAIWAICCTRKFPLRAPKALASTRLVEVPRMSYHRVSSGSTTADDPCLCMMLRSRSKTSVALAIFTTCFVCYLLFLSGHHYSIDGIVMFQYAKALWFDHSLRMNPPIRWGEYEHAVPQWSIGLSLAYTPLVAVLSNTIFVADTSIRKIPDPSSTNYSQQLLYDPHYQYCSVLNPAVTALSAVVLYLLCLELGLSNQKAGATALTFGLFSPATVYSKLDFAQPLVTLFLLLGFVFLLKEEATHRGSYLSTAGICFGLAVLTRSEFLIVAPLLVLSVYFMPDRAVSAATNNPVHTLRRPLLFGLPLGTIILINQGINFLKFGSWLSTGYPLGYYLIFDLKHWFTAFVGNLISPGRGVLLFFPVSILSLVGFKKLTASHRWFARTVFVFLSWEFLFYPIWRTWDGGICWGPRYLIPVLPYLSLLAYVALPPVIAFSRRFIVVLLLAFGAIAALQGLLFGFEFYASLGLTSAQLEQQLYHFSFFMSPIFAGWNGLFQPSSYDIKWLHLDAGNKIGLLLPFFGVLCVAPLIRFWFNFFRSPDIDATVCRDRRANIVSA